MKLRHTMLAVLTVMLVGLVSSCSKRGDILDTIPADVTMVGTVNLDKLCSAVGVTLNGDGTTEVIEPMQGVFRDNTKMLDMMARLKADGVMDDENVVVAMDGDNVAFVTMTVGDMDKFNESTGNFVEWNEASDGYRSARTDICTLLAKDDQIWIVNGTRDAIKAVEDLLKRAKEMPVSKIDGVAEALSRDNMVNVAVAAGGGSKAKSDKDEAIQDKGWNIASLKVGDDNSLLLDWEIISSADVAKEMQNINPALLAYVPENFNMVMAAGFTPEFNWEPMRKLVMLAGGFQTAAFMSVVNPYLESIDGTVLMAAAPSSPELFGEGDVSDWDFIVMANMPRDKIDSLMGMIRNMMSTAGMAPTMTADGLMAIPQYGKTMYIGNVDGYLGISTIGFDNTRNNSLAPTFANKDMAASLSLEPYSAYVPDAPEGTGILLSASMDNGKGTIKLKANGTQYPVLAFLMTAME